MAKMTTTAGKNIEVNAKEDGSGVTLAVGGGATGVITADLTKEEAEQASKLLADEAGSLAKTDKKEEKKA